jgi:hypothetical protein
MDIVTTLPVRMDGPESIAPLLEEVRERTTRRAYKNFLDRGAAHGHALDDWLQAERDLIIRPPAEVYCKGEDVFVEMILPEIDLPNLTVHFAPSQLVISSDLNDSGLQLCQVIDLPIAISLDGVDAEQWSNILRITAAVA